MKSHTSGDDLISQGNWKADEEVKAAAARQEYQDIYTAEQITHIDHDILKDMQQSSPDFAAVLTHGLSHTSTGGMYERINKIYITYGF